MCLPVGYGDNTIIGSNGNDFIATNDINPDGSGGNDVVVLGGGDDTYAGGVSVSGASYNWSVTAATSSDGFVYQPINVEDGADVYINPYPEPYNGVYNTVDGIESTPFGASNASIYGGTGNYLIALGNGNNFVDVGSGNSTIGGGMGNDSIIAGSGNDNIFGGGGTNYVEGGSGTDIIYGGDGSNTIIGGSGDATIYSSSYGPDDIPFPNDSLVSDYVTGGSGNDLIYGSPSAATLIGGTGNVTIIGGSGNQDITGGSGNDNLTGGTGNNTIDAGGAGADTLVAGGSSTSTSILYGGDGRDFITGGSGINTLYAGDGGTAGAATTVYASQTDATATTTIYGGQGVDLLEGGVGTSVIYAGDGGTSAAPTTVIGSSGTQTLYGGLGTDLLQAGSGNALVYAGDGGTVAAPTTVLGGSGIDTLNGGAGPSLLEDTVSGQDLLISSTANDTLVGVGNDTLVAGSGNDLLQTNGGVTNFEFNAGLGNDTIVGQGGSVNLLLGTGLLATDFTGSISFDGTLNNYLTLSGDGGSITIENALTGALMSAAYADPSTIPLATLLTDVFGGDQTVPSVNNSSLILGLANSETITTLQSNDTISAFGDNETIEAGGYPGAYIYSTGSAALIASQSGSDRIDSTGASANIAGGTYPSQITVAGANAVVTTTSRYDTVTASGNNDTLMAVSGYSEFYVNNSSTVIQVSGAAVADTVVAAVSFTAPNNVNYLTLTGSANIAATGNSGADKLTGGAGFDTLTAGSGLATLIGGTGSTTFVINNVGDVVQGASATTTNALQSSVSYSLPTNVNSLLLTGTAALLGSGNNGNDTLISNAGVDTLVGGTGNDTFVVNNPSDVVIDTAGTATIVYSAAANYTLPANALYLMLSGTAALKATGNGGADTLISNSGIDTLIGGTGNDTFVVNNPLDVVQDTAAGTTNVLQASVTYSLPTNIATLTLVGSGALGATGNSVADLITANSGNDTLIAGTGVATLVGGVGNDTFVVNSANDVVQDTSSTALNTLRAGLSVTLPTNVNNLLLTGTSALIGTANAGNDTLGSNSGLDTLVGGSGNETFIVNNSGDVVQDSVASATNTALSSVNYSLPTNVNTLTLSGTNALLATANSGNDLLTANTGVDTLVSGSGNDTLVSGSAQANSLVGGTGNTLFVINNSGDSVTVGASPGSDTIESSFSTTLPSAVAVLALTGTANLTGVAAGGGEIIGNSGNDVLKLSSVAGVLVSGSGIDTLVGGAGSDLLYVNNSADVCQSLGSALNQIISSVSYTLPTNATTLTLTGSANLQAAGNSQTSSLSANSGNDTLIAGSGVTTFYTGEGFDLFVVNNANDRVVGAPNGTKFGTDTIDSSVSYSASAAATLVFTGSANLTGTETAGFATTLIANAGQDTLTAGTGNDTLVAGNGPTTLIGGASNDTFIINNASDLVRDTVTGHTNVLLSSVNVSLPTNVNLLLLTGSAALSATANGANDSLVGNAGADTLIAGTGYDTLVAGQGLATLKGGAGNDTFVVNNTADSIQSASLGQNAVRSSATFVLPANVNLLVLTGLANIDGTGNAGLDTLIGGAGADTLNAGTGLATLIGGLGNTTFIVNATGDAVLDSFTTTTNNVVSSVNYTLTANVNAMSFTGTAALKGTANAGNDTLISNTGVDTLVGGSGSDTFFINNSGDLIQDTLASGANVAQSSVSYSLANDVNTLVLTGTAALRGTANSGADTLVSNGGVDTLVGGASADTFVVNNALDVVQDTITAANSILASVSYTLPTNVNALRLSGTAALIATGNVAADLINANSGNDTLVAGSGIATLIGGQGADTFVVNNINDIVQSTFSAAYNTLQSSVSFTLSTNVNNLVLTGTTALVGTANSGSDTLNSNVGIDTLVGGAGSDVFVLNNASDVIVNGAANDTIESSFGFSLPSSINNLILTGSANLAATGNSNTDVITANSGADTLTAGSYLTTLIGGSGNDVFVVSATYANFVEDSSTTANNLILSSVSYTLPIDVDSLTLTGTANVSATGNVDDSNVLTANAGNDVLYGTALNNTLLGGAGSDTIYAGPGENVIYAGNGGGVVYGAGNGSSTFVQSTIYGGTGGAATSLYGGPGSDLIYGGAGPEQLISGSGYDTLIGAVGNMLIDTLSGADLLVAGAGAETLMGAGADTLQAGSGNEYLTTDVDSSLAEATTLVFGPTPGQDTVTGDIQNIVFAGVSPGTVTATESINAYGTPTLVINDGSGSIQLYNGLAPGSVGTVQFSGSSAMTFDQFMNLYGPGTLTVSSGPEQSFLSTSNAQTVLEQVTDNYAFVFGNADSIANAPGNPGNDYVPVDVYGNNSTLTTYASDVVGNDDLIFYGTRAVLEGTNETVVSGTGQDGTFTVEDASDVFEAAANSFDSIVSYVSYTLPTNVAQLYLASADLIATGNSVGGTLQAGGAYDTLIGGSGNDTLTALSGDDDLIGGSGGNIFVLDASPIETVQLGSGTASLNSVLTSFSYTLGGAANTLTETGNYAAGGANSANDSLTATGRGDTLVAGSGNDTLVDGSTSGGVAMTGGSGTDTFVVDNAADVITESLGGTNSVVLASVSYSLPGNVNALVLGGVGGLTATANAGNDSLVAGTGSDTLVAGPGADTLVAGGGPDTFVFNPGFGQELVSNVGNGDVIDFGAGIAESSLTYTAVLGSGSASPSLVISGDGGSITVPGGLTANAISSIEFSNDTSYTVPELLAPTGRTTIVGPNGNFIISDINNDSVAGGSGLDTIYAYGNNDTLTAGSGGTLINAGGNNSQVYGGTATDTLDAVGASDTLSGGSGNETFVVNTASTDVLAAVGALRNTLLSSVSYTVPLNLTSMTLIGTAALIGTGNPGNDVITGNSGFDTLIAGTGIDTLIGGSLADTFVVNAADDVVLPAANSFNDTVDSTALSYTLPANVNSIVVGSGDVGVGNAGNDYLQATGVATLIAGSGNDVLQSLGSASGDLLMGGSGQDVLIGNADEVFDSGSGVDTLESDSAYYTDNTYIINNSADVLGPLYWGDTIESSVNYTWTGFVDGELAGGVTWNLIGTGGILATDLENYPVLADVTFDAMSPNDTMVGGAGNNDFFGGAGLPETFIGGPATNQFTVQDSADVVTAPSGSFDTVTSYLSSYSLPTNVNTLVLVLPGDLGIGNSGSDTLFGDGGGDTLVAGSGSDSLYSFYGGDTLVAGSGNDTLAAKPLEQYENETYVQVFNSGAFVLNSGFGSVLINGASPTPGTLVEFGTGVPESSMVVTAALDPLGNAALKIADGTSSVTLDGIASGNTYRVQFAGGSAMNLGQFFSQVTVTTSSVAGATGNVILDGTPSALLTGGSGNDTLYAAAAHDTLVAGSAAQSLNALGSNETLVDGSATDTLVGYGGATTYIIGNSSTIVDEQLSDTIESSVNFNVYGDYLTGIGGTIVLTGSAALMAAGSETGPDTLVANSGADTLYGGSYGDTFVVNSAADDVIEDLSNPANALVASINYTLPTNVNQLILSGSANLVGTANSAADTLQSNAGSDTLVGGAGNDTFIVNNIGDVIQDTSTTATNILEATVNFTLPTNVNRLVLTGTGNLAGTGNSANDSLVGGSGLDTLNAGSGTDTLQAGAGASTLIGGSGNDLFIVNNSADLIVDTSTTATNAVQSSVSYSLVTNVNSLTLTGTAALTGTANGGVATLTSNTGADTLVGGAGNDTFVISSAADVIQDTISTTSNTVKSAVSYSLVANVNNLILTGSANLSGVANSGNDSLTGNSGADTLRGGAGIDTLVAGSGVTTLIGGSGNTTFVINNASDAVQDTYSTASNTLRSSVTYVLPTDVNALVLTGTLALKGTANSGADTLTSNSAIDTLVGGSGNDVFVVSNASDVVQDTSSSATNLIESTVSFTLPTDVNALTFTGSTALHGTGNAGNDSMTANSGADTLSAGNGTDTLVSGSGSAADSLVGGTGADLFVVNYAGDIVSVGSTHGVDSIESAVSYTNAANVANLILTGTANLVGTGYTLADKITANSGNDTLNAGTAAATLVGGVGNDTFVVNSASDVVQDTSTTAINSIQSSVSYTLATNVNRLILTGSASLVGTANSGNDTLAANAGTDTLVSGTGSAVDSLVGGTGADLFIVNNASDIVNVGSTHGVDTIQSSVSYSAAANVAYLTLTGTAALAGTGNSLAGTLTANTGSDTLTAGSGADTLVAGTGSDIFVVNSASDIVSVGGSHGVDTIESSVSYTASTNVAALTLTGTSNLAATGNALANVLTANSGTDTLTGVSGSTTLIGGAGNDTFIVNSANDVVQDTSTTATNNIQSSVSYTLATNVNRLILTGSANLVGTANSGNDTLTANTGADTLVSGTGTAVDSLVGGTGADLFIVNNASDIVNVGSTHGVDTIQASVSYSAAANVANLTLTGTAALAGTGSSTAGTITANTGNDTLTGVSSTDTLVGGSGTDVFVVNSSTQAVSISASGTSDTIQSSASYTLPTNVQYLALTGSGALTGMGNNLTDLIIGNTGNDTLTGGSGIAALEGGRTAGSVHLTATGNQAALIAGGGSSTLTGGAYKDFYAAGKVSDNITTGATVNVVSVNKGDGATTLTPTSSATNVLSLGAGIDTESLYFTKTGNNLILTDGVGGDSITFSNWYLGTADQDYTTLQVVEIASANYNSGGSDALRNKALEDFNFTSLVAAYNTAGSPANWALSTAMPSAQLASSSTADYGGDLAYYFGLNGNLTGVDLSAVQSTLTNASFGTAAQTIDAFSSISGGGGLHLLVTQPPTRISIPIVSPQPLGVAAKPVDSRLSGAIADAHLPERRAPAEDSAGAPGFITPRRATVWPVRPLPTEVNSVTASGVLAALSGRHSEPQIRHPNHGPAMSYVEPINVGWITLHGALDQANEAALGGTETSAAHETNAGDALLTGGLRLSRTERITDPNVHSPIARQRAM